jgi:outer membrane protein TolC
MKKTGILLFGFLCWVVGCGSVGPNYQRKDPSVPSDSGSLEKGITTSESVGNEFLGSWWKIFQDPVLDSLKGMAVSGNQDLRIAQARVQQARALSLVSSSKQFPEGGLSGTYERIRRTESGSSVQISSGEERQNSN